MVAAVASKSPDPVDLHTQLSVGRDDNKDESSPGGQDLRGEDARQHPLIWRGTKIRLSHRYARRYGPPGRDEPPEARRRP